MAQISAVPKDTTFQAAQDFQRHDIDEDIEEDNFYGMVGNQRAPETVTTAQLSAEQPMLEWVDSSQHGAITADSHFTSLPRTHLSGNSGANDTHDPESFFYH